MSFKIAIIGTGYVGLVSGTTFAAMGNNVICVDIDESKVNILKQGKTPIFEPKLEHLLERNIKEERLTFTTNLNYAIEHSSLIFLCLPTPPNEDGSADLQHVLKVAGEIATYFKNKNISDKKILVNKSTVPVGTSKKVRKILDDIYPENQIEVVSNPEFLREGFAIDDALKPDRVVIGTRSQWVKEIMTDLYKPFLRSGHPIYYMDEESSEITKYAANAFLATKISFMNDLSEYCEKVGADIEKVRLGIGSDTRIGNRFLFAGIGYGGSCFPKDVRALIYSSESEGIELEVVKAAWEVNKYQIKRFITKINSRFSNDISNKKFALWGLSFKPNTDDTREAPAFEIIDFLLANNCTINAYDPEGVENTKIKYGDKLNYCKTMYDCLDQAEALIIATEWDVFRIPDYKLIKSMLKNNIIFDGRNLYSPKEMNQEGFEYYCIGRNINAE